MRGLACCRRRRSTKHQAVTLVIVFFLLLLFPLFKFLSYYSYLGELFAFFLFMKKSTVLSMCVRGSFLRNLLHTIAHYQRFTKRQLGHTFLFACLCDILTQRKSRAQAKLAWLTYLAGITSLLREGKRLFGINDNYLNGDAWKGKKNKKNTHFWRLSRVADPRQLNTNSIRFVS